jgi:predicted permease
VIDMHRFLLKLLRRKRIEEDLEAELAFHREMANAAGSHIPLGNETVIKERARDLWRFNRIENLWRDLLYALRNLRRSPGFAASALLSLAIGIGVNTTIFSLAVEFLLSEPSVTDPKSLVYVQLGGNSDAPPRAIEYLRQSGVFQDVAAEAIESYINWNNGAETRPVFAVQATKNYFAALGVPVAYGRGWRTDDPDEVVVLGYDFWRRNLNADRSILGRTLQLDGRAYTVVGVLPESHRTLIGFGFSPDVYVPRYVPNAVMSIYVRLKPGMSAGSARAAMTVLAQRLDHDLPESWKYSSQVKIVPVSGFARMELQDEAMTIGLFFAILLFLVGLVLLIACINVASMVLARASARRTEIAIRLSLGASRGRLFQQLLSESLLLALAGAGLGFSFALIAAKLLASIPLPLPFPIHVRVEPDWRVATYAAVLAVISTIAAGVAPAWQCVRDSIASSLHRDRRLRTRRVLVAVQVAISFVVLTTGALFLHNLIRATAISPGFDVRRTVRAEVHLPRASYHDSIAINRYVDESLVQLRAMPGVESAAAARIIPFTGATRFGSELRFPATGKTANAEFHWNAVSPDFFLAMDIPVLAGRAFSNQDRRGPKVVIVNEEFARRYVKDQEAIGASFYWHDGNGSEPYQIVGVVRGTKNLTIGEDAIPQLYEPLSQVESDRPQIEFVVRSEIPPASQLTQVRKVLRGVEPAAGLEVATMFSSIGLAFLPSQVGAVLMTIVGVVGLLLASLGLYGVVAYAVTRRTREIGIRIAIGATRMEIAKLVLASTGRMLAIGVAAGLFLSFFVTRPLAAFLVPGLGPTDLASFSAVVFVFVITGILAVAGPLRHANSINPVQCLRYE